MKCCWCPRLLEDRRSRQPSHTLLLERAAPSGRFFLWRRPALDPHESSSRDRLGLSSCCVRNYAVHDQLPPRQGDCSHNQLSDESLEGDSSNRYPNAPKRPQPCARGAETHNEANCTNALLPRKWILQGSIGRLRAFEPLPEPPSENSKAKDRTRVLQNLESRNRSQHWQRQALAEPGKMPVRPRVRMRKRVPQDMSRDPQQGRHDNQEKSGSAAKAKFSQTRSEPFLDGFG